MQLTRGGRMAMLAMLALGVFVASGSNATAAAPQLSKVGVSAVGLTSATLEAGINPQGNKTLYIFEYGPADCSKSACTIALEGRLEAGSSVVHVPAPLAGLAPATIYHYRVEAKSLEGKTQSKELAFATYSAALVGLPDGRAYEQASPVNKDGNDALGDLSLVKSTVSGGGITFGSTFGIPGGKGAQELPGYLASRGASDWSTQGLLPPPSVGERAKVIGWTPDFTEVFSEATKLGATRFTALVEQSSTGGEPIVIAPYTADAEYAYAGSSQDGTSVFFESSQQVPPREGKAPNPGALKEAPNLYSWNRESEEVSLVGVLNSKSPPVKGVFAGSYDWARGISARSLVLGGATGGYYLQDEHAVTPEGSIYFTEAGTGQLFLRRNPTSPQSTVVTNGKGEEECSELAKACTIHVSATHKENGQGQGGADSAGPQPAAFQTATRDGTEAFFTSPEKLTDNANTGPEQPPAQIELGSLAGAIEKANFIPAHAVGVAVDGSHVYWADPKAGTIGRADLDGKNPDPNFITPGPVEFEFQFKVKPGVFETRKETIESEPRYVAVDAGHVYWTNSGRSDEFGAVDKEGTIGRADIEGTPGSIEPALIRGASNPQGIAVNAEDLYWANAGKASAARAIARAAIGGGGAEEEFHLIQNSNLVPYGVALNPTHVYLSANEEENDNGSIRRIPLEGGPEEFLGIGKEGIRGVAVDAAHVYWTTQGEEAVGRASLELEAASRENKFIQLEGKPNGVAVNGAHLYWATNGEAPTNPGNDLYRFKAASGTGSGKLTDLTPDSGDTNGAEVQGLLGAAADGSYLYFAANGVLAEGAEAGSCEGGVGSASGSCNLYVWHEGVSGFVARLKNDDGQFPDSLNWTATPRGQFGTASYVPKSAFTSTDGKTLLFRSQERLTAYENEGVPELYRFHVGDTKIRCVSCPPSGEAVERGPQTGRTLFPGIGPAASVAAINSRNLSADGEQAFFETAESLSLADTNGQGGCPPSGTGVQDFPACEDVYEWEATGAGGCQESSPSYSPFNEGCVYLISNGKSEFPSLFADASASGEDVFFFTRQQLVGQDTDQLQDVYDARVGGGLASQNEPPAVPCEAPESCHGPAQAPLAEGSPATPGFVGPGNQVPKHKNQKTKKKSKHHKNKKHHKKHKRAGTTGRGGR
jgi:hypothetical protein